VVDVPARRPIVVVGPVVGGHPARPFRTVAVAGTGPGLVTAGAVVAPGRTSTPVAAALTESGSRPFCVAGTAGEPGAAGAARGVVAAVRGAPLPSAAGRSAAPPSEGDTGAPQDEEADDDRTEQADSHERTPSPTASQHASNRARGR
jgi:hypothetical protein